MVDQNPLADGAFHTVTMKDVVYQRIKDAIIAGRFQPGERLKEGTVSTMLNVSRTPLREAIRRLEQEQLVERLPQGGVAVSSLSPEAALELNEIRAQLEALAARIAAQRVRDGERGDGSALARLEELAATMYDNVVDLQSDQGHAFHALIHALAGRPRLTSMLEHVLDGLKRYRVLIPAERKRVVAQEHQAITRAIGAGDPDTAEQLMRAHILAASDVYRALGQRRGE